MALTLRPHPIQGESIAGHLLRAFTINGEPWTTAAINLNKLVGTDGDALLSQAVGKDPGLLRTSTPSEMTTKLVRIGKEVLSRRGWTIGARRWCPACWQEDMRAPRVGRHQFW